MCPEVVCMCGRFYLHRILTQFCWSTSLNTDCPLVRGLGCKDFLVFFRTQFKGKATNLFVSYWLIKQTKSKTKRPHASKNKVRLLHGRYREEWAFSIVIFHNIVLDTKVTIYHKTSSIFFSSIIRLCCFNVITIPKLKANMCF